MPPRQLSVLMTRGADRAQDFTCLIQLDDPIEADIDHPNMLIGCNPEPIWIANTRPLSKKMTVCVEYLDTRILSITNVDAIVFVDDHRVRKHELARTRTVGTPCFNEIAVAIKLDHT